MKFFMILGIVIVAVVAFFAVGTIAEKTETKRDNAINYSNAMSDGITFLVALSHLQCTGDCTFSVVTQHSGYNQQSHYNHIEATITLHGISPICSPIIDSFEKYKKTQINKAIQAIHGDYPANMMCADVDAASDAANKQLIHILFDSYTPEEYLFRNLREYMKPAPNGKDMIIKDYPVFCTGEDFIQDTTKAIRFLELLKQRCSVILPNAETATNGKSILISF